MYLCLLKSQGLVVKTGIRCVRKWSRGGESQQCPRLPGLGVGQVKGSATQNCDHTGRRLTGTTSQSEYGRSGPEQKAMPEKYKHANNNLLVQVDKIDSLLATSQKLTLMEQSALD